MGSESAAKNGARTSCIKKHAGRENNCRLVTSFYNGCISIYLGSNKVGAYGTHGFNLNDAKARGANQCYEGGGRECKEIMSFCTTIPTYY